MISAAGPGKRSTGLLLIAVALAGAGAYRALHVPPMLVGRPALPLLVGFVLQAVFGIAAGVAVYWVATRFMHGLGIAAAEVQAMIWFTATIVGVALASGRLGAWPVLDQVVAISVIVGVGWLMVRQSATA